MKNEKKEHIVTVRLTDTEYQECGKRAAENHQTLSRYMAESAAGNRQGVSLSQKRSIYHSLLIIKDALSQAGNAKNEKIIIEECNKIWKSLSN